MTVWRRATVVALLLAIWGAARWEAALWPEFGRWDERLERAVVYFADREAMGVAPELRWFPPGEIDPEVLLEELIAGPKSPNLVASIPPRTRVRSVVREGETLIVDFDREIVLGHPGGSAGEIVTVYSVVNTLTDLPGVKQVAWRIDGEVVDTLVGHMDLSRPLVRNEDVIVRPSPSGHAPQGGQARPLRPDA